MAGSVSAQVLAMADALELAGVRIILTQEFQRGGPCFLVGKGGKNRPLQWVSNAESNSARPQQNREARRYEAWLNYGQDPVAPTAVWVDSTAEAIEWANWEYNAPPGWPTSIVLASSQPTQTIPDAYQNAFRHDFLGAANNFAAVDASRIIFGEGSRTASPSAQSAYVHCVVKNGDSPPRTEIYNSDESNGRTFKAGDTVDVSFEVAFPSDYPVAGTQRRSVMRLSAYTNGLPPLEFLVRKNGSNVDTLYLRENGSAHDLAAETTLNAAGGYIYSTPLVRMASYSVMNWFKFTVRMFMATDSTGWVELYKDYNFTTPVMARVQCKNLTDTSGTVRSYARFGTDRHTSYTGDERVILENCRVKITRPP